MRAKLGFALMLLKDRASLAGFLYLGLGAVANLLLLPIYVRWLGAEAWGVLALCLSLQGALFALEPLLSARLIRELVRLPADALARRLRPWLGRGLALGLFLLIGLQLLLVALEPGIGESSRVALHLATLQAALGFANLLLMAGWSARGQQVRAYAHQGGFLLARHLAALTALAALQPSAATYFAALSLVSSIELMSGLVGSGVMLRKSHRDAAASPIVRPTEESTLPMQSMSVFMLGAVASAASGHVDRLWLSASLPTEMFGAYFLLGVVVLSLLHLQAPLQRAWLPRITAEADPGHSLRALRWMLAGVVVVPSLLLAIHPAWWLALWLGEGAAAVELAPALRLMLLATVCLALSTPWQALLLRARRYASIATLAITSLAVQLLLLLILEPRLGVQAGAIAWLGLGLTQWLGSALLVRASAQRASR